MSAIFVLLALAALVIGIFINNIYLFMLGTLGYFFFFIVYHNNKKELIDGGFLVSLLIFATIFVIAVCIRNLHMFYCSIMGFAACFVIIPIYRNYVINSLPTAQVLATVISKYTKMSGQFTITVYYITFELDDGARKVFPVTTEVYGLMQEGDSGVLNFRELGKLKKFISFTPLKDN